MTISVSINLDSTQSETKGATLIGNKLTWISAMKGFSYGPDWVFDSSTTISLCSDYDGNYGVDCIIQNLKVAYKESTQLITMPISNTRNLKLVDFSSHLEI